MQVNYQSLLAQIRDGVYFTDLNRQITFWNTGAQRITGFTADEVIGHRCADNLLVHVDEEGRSLCKGLCPLAATMKDSVHREAKVYLRHKEGYRVPVYVRTTVLQDNDGGIIGGAEFFSDFSHQEMMSERIRELETLALLDRLTRLPNRHHIEVELSTRFHEQSRMNIDFGLLFLDLDHFKTINDTYGHIVGDKVLLIVANTLKEAVRPFDMVGRWGGEEFICIVRNADKAVLGIVARRLLHMTRATAIPTGKVTLRVTASIGATLARSDDTIDRLVKRADELMYIAKQNGRDQIRYG